MTIHPTGSDAEVRYTPRLRSIQSGEWRDLSHIADYRFEWLSGLLVERATWHVDAEPYSVNGVQIGGSEWVWFRFWLPEPRQIIDKYFDVQGDAVGVYMPISDPIELHGDQYSALHLLLGLWLQPSGRLTVTGEDRFEDAIKQGQLTSEQIQWAEVRIREMTAEINRDRLPPPLIRNFAIR
jgi:predicted RNA-binding protein associated with RNAse of E/G family